MSRIAIIGMACLYPGAPTLEHFWQNIVNGVDAISEVPASRWDASFHDPRSTAVDRFYCRRGGFVDAWASFDPLAFGIMPRAAAAAEPDQLLTLKVGFEALRDAGYADRPFAREKTGVIVGRGNYVTAGVLRLEQHVRLLPQVMRTLQDLFPALAADQLEQARLRLQREFSYYGPDVAAGMIPNLIASRLANRLDLHGPAYTVDAACASSLIALEQACQSLRRGDSEMMLVGGAHLTHDLTFWATFCQLGALSRSGVVRPLSRQADGILAGEGVGMVVLRRLKDAEAAGDRIYAVIDGVGSSSDGRASSLVAPSVEGQLMALEQAWSQVDFDRHDIGLLEAHGTGTPAGDEAEIETLGRYFGSHGGRGERAVIGSVKSMIGHTMPAAGMAGLIKTALAIHHGIQPPTLHCDDPHPRLAETCFEALAQARPWQRDRSERVAAVNAFGFGGINAHVVLRGQGGAAGAAAATLARVQPPAVLTLSAATPAELLLRLERGEHDAVPGNGACRLAIIEPDQKRLVLARKVIAAGKAWPGRQQVYFSPDGLVRQGGKLAILFPGVDSRFQPQAADLARYFGKPLPRLCEPLDPAASLVKVVVGLLGFNRYLFDILARLGIRADAMAGHSVGEWSAMLASGMMDQGLSDRTNEGLDFDAVKFPDVQFLAAGCGQEKLTEAMRGLVDIAISHDNCPHQVIACGRREAIAVLASRLRELNVFTQILPIVSGFHSPLFDGHMGWYRDFFSQAQLAEPRVPVWSATLAAPFPATVAERRQVALDHLLQPVRFRELTESLYADGCRVFLQVGTGSLTGFVGDTLEKRPHLALAANQEGRTGLEQLTHVCAALWVEGAEFDTQLLRLPQAAARPADPAREIRLSLGVPLVRIGEPLSTVSPLPASRPELPAHADPVQRLLHDTLTDIEKAGRDVLALWQQTQPAAQSVAIRHRVSRCLDIDSTIPWVRDHELYPQRPGWPVVADRHPVVPLTMEVMLVREAVEELLPGLRVVEVRNIHAYNWLAVARPLTVEIALESADGRVIDAEIEGYFRAQVVVAPDYPGIAPPAMAPLQEARPPAVDAVALYEDHWMFHGPAYRGVREISAIGDNGIEGLLAVTAGKGALLDNMGQLAGYWVMEQPDNCLAMPIGVDCIRFCGPDPVPHETLRASVRIRELDGLSAVSDHCLRDAGGRVRIIIEGWRTRRYQMDKGFWLASRQLHRQGVSRPLAEDRVLFDDSYDTAILRDYLARRYLAAAEFAVYESLSPRRRRQWLNGRVAAKDAVCNYLRDVLGQAAVYPKEVRIENDAGGVPRVLANVTQTVPAGLHVSLAHKEELAVAIAGESAVGIDIEVIEPREASFAALVLDDTEQALLADEEPAEALTRAWVAKEALAKMQGTGLGGNPRRFRIQARQGEQLLVNGQWVDTARSGRYMLAWTCASSPAGDHARVSPAQKESGNDRVHRP